MTITFSSIVCYDIKTLNTTKTNYLLQNIKTYHKIVKLFYLKYVLIKFCSLFFTDESTM